MCYLFKCIIRLCTLNDYIASTLAPCESSLDYQECRTEGVLVPLVDLSEDHTWDMSELIF